MQASSQTPSLESIKAPVEDNFKAVDDLIIGSLHSEANIINDLGRYILQSGGKRLRPLVTLLTAKACGYQGKQHISFAAIIEFLHTATLLHDDVVDKSDFRRGNKTANHIWGNEASVLVGDYLFSNAFLLCLKEGNNRITHILVDAIRIISEGEVLQLLDRHNTETTEGAYLNIIRSKTAKLFEAAAQIGAILGHENLEQANLRQVKKHEGKDYTDKDHVKQDHIEKDMARFGMHFGLAFQLIDDILDYSANPNKTGKGLGNDLAEGKVTLPLIYLLQNSNPREISQLRLAIKEGGGEHLPMVQQMLANSDAIEYSKRFAQLEAERAIRALENLKDSVYKEALIALSHFAVERDH